MNRVYLSARTTIGFGSKSQGTEKVHGAPLGNEDVANAKKILGFDPSQSFFVPTDVQSFYASIKEKGAASENAWNELFSGYSKSFPDLVSRA